MGSVAPRDPQHKSENIDFGEGVTITIEDLNVFNKELEVAVRKMWTITKVFVCTTRILMLHYPRIERIKCWKYNARMDQRTFMDSIHFTSVSKKKRNSISN